MIKRLILRTLILVSCLISISLSNIDTLVIKSGSVTTNYLNVMQNQQFIFQMSGADYATINISNKIIVFLDGTVGSGVSYVRQGSSYLDGQSFTKNGATYTLSIRLKWQNNFVQNQAYVVTINNDAGSVTSNILTYNESFIIQTFNIQSYPEYMFQDGSDLWFKGGISAVQGVNCAGIIRYEYPLGSTYVYPLKDVSAKLYFDNVYEGSVVSVLTNGSFEFNNFTIPVSATGVSDHVKLKINVEFPIGKAFLNTSNYTNTKNIKIDNQPPIQNTAVLSLLPDFYNNDAITNIAGVRVQPETGWYNQTTVSVKITNLAGLSDSSGSGLNPQFLYEATDESKYASPDSTVNIRTIEGLSRIINVYVLDKVSNRLTMSALVSVDVTPPGIFYLTLDDDNDNSINQMKPQASWYNDETVSMSWTQPSDVALRLLPYQIRSDFGWPTWSAQIGSVISLNHFQSTKQVSVLFVNEGGSTIRKAIVRAIDKAGNIRKVEQQLYVDTTPPSVNYLKLLADTTFEEGHRTPETGWYNDGSEVRWMWSVSDAGMLPNQPYSYRNLNGIKSIVRVTTNVNDAIVDTSEAPTGNVFELKIWDMAGNVTFVTKTVYVDETAADFNSVGINFINDNTDNLSDGVPPNAGWYDQATVNLVLTWNMNHTAEEKQWELSRLYVKTLQDTAYTMHTANNPTFSMYTIIPQDNTPIIFTALFVNKAGWTRYINSSIKADVTTPSNLNITLHSDTDSGGDDVAPMNGWYDDNTIDLNWDQPIDSGKLRDKPYRLKINNNGWSNWQSEQYKYDLVVSNNTKNIVYIQAADEAGNIVINSVQLTVDTIVPLGSFTLKLEDDLTAPIAGGVAPDIGSHWYNDVNVKVSFISENITNSSDLRTVRYFIKNLTSKTSYGAGFSNSQNVPITTPAGGDQTNAMTGAIADKAGNVIQYTNYVMVDMVKPDPFIATVYNDTTDNDLNGFLPSANWYDEEKVGIYWDAADDDGSLHLYPYRVRSDTTTNWSVWINTRNYTNLEVKETPAITHNIYIQARDKAGNITTKGITIKIDRTPPKFITYNVVSPAIISDPDIPSGIKLPLSGWFKQEVITMSWTVPSENGQLRKNPYRQKASRGQTAYTAFNNKVTTTINVTANNHNKSIVYFYAIDEAGNSSEVTRSLKVDIVAPILTINYTVTRSFIKPYVITRDVLFVTLQVSEALSVDPILKYINVNSSNISASITLTRYQTSWYASVNIKSLVDGLYKFYPIVFDNAGNKTTRNYGDTHFIVSTQIPPSANGFVAWSDLITYNAKYVQTPYLYVTYNVDDRVKSFWVTEEGGQKPFDNAASFIAHPSFNYMYTLQKNGAKVDDGMKDLFLWVKDEKERYSSSSVLYQIYYDHTTPAVKIKPAGGQQTTVGDDYNNVVVASTEITAILEIWNQSSDTAYIERASTTPSWKVYLPGINNRMITVNLNPRLSNTASDPNTDKYRTEWFATYNAGLAQVSGNGYFTVCVTDNAFNYTEEIKAGKTFLVNVDAATNPDLYLYSLDGRVGYTRWLTINVVISKDSEHAIYDSYKIVNGSYTKPGSNEFTSIWPASTKRLSINYRIDDGVAVSEANQGVKSIYVWTKKDPSYVNPGIIMKKITYDATVPTYTIKSDIYKYGIGEPEAVRTTICVSEKLDNHPTPMIYLLDSGSNLLKDEFNKELKYAFKFSSYRQGRYEYITTLNIPSEHKNKYILLHVVADDLAGNRLDSKIAFRQQLVVMQYKSEINPLNKIVEKGGTDYAFLSCVVSSNDQPVHLSGIKVLVDGHFIPSDVSMVSIYSDGDNNGLLEPRKKYDVLKGISSTDLDAGSILYIPFDEVEIIVSSSSKRFFVVVDIGNEAIAGNTLRVQFTTVNAFTVASDEVVDYSKINRSYFSDLVEIIDVESTIIISNLEENDVVTTINQGSEYGLLKKLQIKADAGNPIWTGLQISVEGSVDPTLFSNISVYIDENKNNLFEEDKDRLISSGQDRFQVNRTTKNIMFDWNWTLQNSYETFFIVGGVDVNMARNTTFNISIVTPNHVFAEGNYVVRGYIYPIKTKTFTIGPYLSKVNMFKNSNVADEVFQGDGIMLQKMLFSVDYYNPRITYVDFALEGGTVRNDFETSGQTLVSLYKLDPSIAYDNDYFYLDYTSQDTSEIIPANVNWMNNDRTLRLSLSSPLILSTENQLALIATINTNAQNDRDFRLVTYMLKSTDNIYIKIQDGIAKEDKTITTNIVTIIHKQQPIRPVISANYYTSKIQEYEATYFSYTKSNNNIVKAEYAIGSYSGGKDKTNNDWVEVVVENPSGWIDYTDTINIVNIELEDNTTYYLSLRLKSEITTNNYRTSRESVYKFHTDFTAPDATMYTPQLAVTEMEDSNTHVKYIHHAISWGKDSFVDNESGLRKFIIEEKSNYTGQWTYLTERYTSNPNIPSRNIDLDVKNGNERKYDMSYSYRVKAVNNAGLESIYIYTDTMSTVKTQKVLSNVSNYPNPFKSRVEKTKIFYFLREDSGIEINIYDSMGHYVRKYNFTKGIAGKSTQGDCSIEWDGKNEASEFVEKGGYFVVIEAPEATGEDKKIVRMVGVIH